MKKIEDYTSEELLELPDIEIVKLTIQESLEDHKNYNSEFWKGSAYMGKNVLEVIETLQKERQNQLTL